MLFLPSRRADRLICEHMIEAAVADEGCTVLGWRDVPVDESVLSAPTRRARPAVRQLFVARMGVAREVDTSSSFEISLYVIRRRIEAALREIPGSDCYLASFSSRTVVYKGMLRPDQLAQFYPDLREPDLASAIAMVHSRFSTNTFPSWRLAHPYRFLCHNGEINTLRGNLSWMRVRESIMSSSRFGGRLASLLPGCAEKQSDSASLDNALELLTLAGRPLAHAMAMLIPEAWEGHATMSPERRAFYEYHASLMEPWDGPAAVAFTDGRQVAAMLDRNGLRPARYVVTSDDFVVLASEAGALEIPVGTVKSRLHHAMARLVALVHPDHTASRRVAENVGMRRERTTVLDVARITTGKISLNRSHVNLAESVERCVRTLEGTDRTSRHAISMECEATWIEADPVRIDQILVNLIGNALKYTPEGGRIDIRVQPASDESVFEILDSGVGMSKEALARAFDLFFQGNRTPDGGEGGLGIGLSLARHLIELHGGSVDAASEGEGRGSRFTVRFPRSVQPASDEVGVATGAAESGRCRILLVEDNEDAREMLQMLLTLAGHDVHGAACEVRRGAFDRR